MSKNGTDKTPRPPHPLHTFSTDNIALRDQLDKQSKGNFHSSSLSGLTAMVSQSELFPVRGLLRPWTSIGMQ